MRKSELIKSELILDTLYSVQLYDYYDTRCYDPIRVLGSSHFNGFLIANVRSRLIFNLQNGEHHRWWYPVYKVFQVNERYFQVWGMIGLTECQESEFEPQVAIEVEQREKVITEWVAVK